MSSPSHGLLSHVATFATGATVAGIVIYSYRRFKDGRRHTHGTLPSNGGGRAMNGGGGGGGGYRRAVSAEETVSERLSRHGRLRRLWSTSGSNAQDEMPVVQVEAGKNDETQAILNLLYYIADDQAKRNGYIHRGITCNLCQQSPLLGTRYKCANCPDYDVCDRCETKDVHNSSHVFVKINIPLPPLSSPRTVLGKILYTGKANNFNTLTLDETLAYTRVTYFDQYEIEALHQEYRSLARSERGISHEVFDMCAGPLALQGNLVIQRLFKFYDQNDDHFIDFEEMIKGMSIIMKGTLEEKMKFAFEGYDFEGRGCISRDNMRRMFKAYFDITIELVRDMVKACEEEMLLNFDDSSGRPVSSLFSAPIPIESMNNNNAASAMAVGGGGGAGGKSAVTGNPGSAGRENTWPIMEAMSQDAIDEMVEAVFRQAEMNADERMSYEQFCEVVKADHEIIAWFEALGTVF